MKPKLVLGLALLLGGLALCGAGLWLLLSPPHYAATARIKVERNLGLFPLLGGILLLKPKS